MLDRDRRRVVGAGPAGAAAAITLARAGRDVVLVDKATFPRDKICGDGLTTGALRLLEELGLDPGGAVLAASGRRRRAVAVGPRGDRSRSPAGAGSTPWSPAARPRRRARSTWPATPGAKVHDGHACSARDERRATASCSTSTASGTSTPATSIAPTACGRPCASCSAASTDGYRGEWHAFRQYFTDVGPAAAAEPVRVVRGRSAPGLRLVLPAPGRPRQRRLRHPARGGKVAGCRT